MTRLLASAALGVGLACAVASAAAACTIDGKPSAYANGTRAAIFRQAPTTATYGWWARFDFPHPFRVGQRIDFHENDAQVRKLLTLADLHRPWRWLFGDGSATIGDRVAHVYRRTGRYRISVDAYFHGYGWQAFDSITITVRR